MRKITADDVLEVVRVNETIEAAVDIVMEPKVYNIFKGAYKLCVATSPTGLAYRLGKKSWELYFS